MSNSTVTKKLTADQLAHQVRRAITESSFAAQVSSDEFFCSLFYCYISFKAKVFGSHVTAESAVGLSSS
jgi:hypothetical protein